MPKSSSSSRRELLFYTKERRENIANCLNLLKISATFRKPQVEENEIDIKQTKLLSGEQIMAFIIVITHYSLFKSTSILDVSESEIVPYETIEKQLIEVNDCYLRRYRATNILTDKEITSLAEKYSEKKTMPFNRELELVRNNGSLNLKAGIFVKIAKIPEKPAQLAHRMLLLGKLCSFVQVPRNYKRMHQKFSIYDEFGLGMFAENIGKWPENYLDIQENSGESYVRALSFVLEDRDELFEILEKADIDQVKKIFAEIIFPEPDTSYLNDLYDNIEAIYSNSENNLTPGVRSDLADILKNTVERGYEKITDFEASLENLLIKAKIVEKEFKDVKNMTSNRKIIDNFKLDIDSKQKEKHCKNFYIHLNNKNL